jgi:hypothetical protein
MMQAKSRPSGADVVQYAHQVLEFSGKITLLSNDLPSGISRQGFVLQPQPSAERAKVSGKLPRNENTHLVNLVLTFVLALDSPL